MLSVTLSHNADCRLDCEAACGTPFYPLLRQISDLIALNRWFFINLHFKIVWFYSRPSQYHPSQYRLPPNNGGIGRDDCINLCMVRHQLEVPLCTGVAIRSLQDQEAEGTNIKLEIKLKTE